MFTEQTTERGSQFVATFDTGLKYLLTENIQLDAGVNIGLTQAADDIQPFMGVSVRF
ncbi:transporter [Oscillatoria nigro-viridis]|uniref:transporter n=1 Tax=Phormidium nigroviride TaxID=482564 RepID=UPI001CBB28D9|nr:transporter [Oscillatoria nigro-viridis]